VDLRQGDAQALDFPDAASTRVCTFSLCAIPDDGRPCEMARVLRPAAVLLADHVRPRAGMPRGLA